MRVVVIEDDPRMLELVCAYLSESGIEATGCSDGDAGLRAVGQVGPDVVVLDLMLPGLSGTAVCRALRAAGNDVPLIMLTARGEVAERVAGFEAGADDYLVKPFALEELQARIRALARRWEATEARLSCGDVSLDVDARRAWVGDAELSLVRREFDLLAALLARRGTVVSRAHLHDQVWVDEAPDLKSNSLEVYVSHLRRALAGSASVRISTVRGIGYRLDG